MPAKTLSARTRRPAPEDDFPITPDTPQDQENVTFPRGHFYSFMVVMAFCTGFLFCYVLLGHSPASGAAGPSPVAQAPAPTPLPIKYDITTAGFPSLGPANAPIVIVEFSDYQCPFCTQWHDTTYQPLLAAYPGKIRLVYRNYPLPFHQNAYPAAEAALCAGDQHEYWQYHDALFANNDQLNNSAGTVLDPSFYVNLAGSIGMDTTSFQNCVSTHKYKQAVQDDLNYANSLPADSDGPAVNGTPTFFINGYRIVGAEPLAYFQQVIDSQLQTQ